MAQPLQGFWYSVGQLIGGISALSDSADRPAAPSERRAGPAAGSRGGARPRERRGRAGAAPPSGARTRRTEDPDAPPDTEGDSLEWFLARGAVSLLTDRTERWLWQRRPGPARFLRAAAAGAGAALAASVVARILNVGPGRDDASADGEEAAEIAEELLAGAGRGLVYASVLEPLVPGPPSFRGAIYGTAEYLMGPWGGLTLYLGQVAPQRRVPVLRELLAPGRTREPSYAESLTEGVVLGALYGSPSRRPGRRDRRKEEDGEA